MFRTKARVYEYFSAFESGLSDEEVARRFKVSLETVERYRRVPRYYDLEGLEELVIQMRRRRSHLSTIFRAARDDSRFHPFDSMFLLAAICRLIRDAGRVFSRLEAVAALKRAFDPRVHDEGQRLAILQMALQTRHGRRMALRA
ncbi:MAG: hypothetical protein ACE5HJ_03985 [Thermoplasmata archaeon]